MMTSDINDMRIEVNRPPPEDIIAAFDSISLRFVRKILGTYPISFPSRCNYRGNECRKDSSHFLVFCRSDGKFEFIYLRFDGSIIYTGGRLGIDKEILLYLNGDSDSVIKFVTACSEHSSMCTKSSFYVPMSYITSLTMDFFTTLDVIDQ